MSERPKLAAIVPSPNNIPIIDLSKLSEGDRDDRATQNRLRGMGISSEEKQKYPMAPGNQKLDWCNMFALGVEPPCIRNLKLWPLKPAHFGDTLEVYSREIRKLCKDLLWYIAVGLGLKGDVFEEMFGVSVQAVRMNYYPPCSRPDLVFGLSPHSDESAITVLQQGKGSSVGLQILRDRKWVSDLSIVASYVPSNEVEVGLMAELVDQKSPCRYRRYNHGDYSKHYVSDKLQDKRTLKFAKTEPETFT
ncbi:hypothetical protein V6N13_013734 [Hibiscus sabdariffa]|uniref:Fe2OG dioxygenase domain-containing protein n=2 Tax=Hibiscus sabdariffa TaxID=183260 RepID=A0ABR2BW90_9ROSI